MVDYDVWRKQIDKMSDDELDKELGKRRTNWYDMIVAETLRRILRKLNQERGTNENNTNK